MFIIIACIFTFACGCVNSAATIYHFFQWSGLVTERYMVTMMVLLCYVNLSGMSLECIVIVLMNNSLLGGQECTDYVNIRQIANNAMERNKLAIIPRLNFTCNGRITSITARVSFNSRINYPLFQVWRASSVGSTIYNKISQVQLPRGVTSRTGVSNFNLTGNNTIEVQSGDVVGCYHPLESRYRVRTIRTDGYILYQFSGSHKSVDLNNAEANDDKQQPMIQFTIGKCLSYLLCVL